MMPRRIAVIGSTGSIGRQTLDVISRAPERFELAAIAAYSSADLLSAQVRAFSPRAAVLVCPPDGFVPEKSATEWGFGVAARDALCAMEGVDDVVVSVVGIAGLTAVLAAIESGKRVLLANKETLMCGGDIVMARAASCGVEIMPIDSEHTAIWQCLRGQRREDVSRLLLTASGGPFRTWDAAAMRAATAEQALRHPNWSMGRKITVDSATMMNKAIEVVEAHHLFSMPPEKIQVVVHPQSVVHSAVEYTNGSVLAQLGVADMRIPILTALCGECGGDSGAERLSLFDMPTLHFERCDESRFPFVPAAYDAIRAGGNACVVLNGANEVAVAAFLEGRITLGGIFDTVFFALDTLFDPAPLSVEGIFSTDAAARAVAAGRIGM